MGVWEKGKAVWDYTRVNSQNFWQIYGGKTATFIQRMTTTEKESSMEMDDIPADEIVGTIVYSGSWLDKNLRPEVILDLMTGQEFYLDDTAQEDGSMGVIRAMDA